MHLAKSVAILVGIGGLAFSPLHAASLESALFCNDPKLEAAAVSDPAHIMLGHVGEHVGKIQQALVQLNGAVIDPAELQAKRYGPSTARAVFLYKQKFTILGPGQTVPDDIVGKKTTAHLDHAMAQIMRCSSGPQPTGPGGKQSDRKTIKFIFRDINGQTLSMKSTSVVLRQRNQEVGRKLLNDNQGVTQVEVMNLFNVTSYDADILAITDPPRGDGVRLQQTNLFLDFQDKFNRGELLIVDILPGTSERHFKHIKQTEIASKLGSELGTSEAAAAGKIAAEISEKTTEGEEQDWTVKYYTGALLVGPMASQ